MMNGMTGAMWLGILLWVLVGVAVLALAAVGVVWLVRHSDGGHKEAPLSVDSAKEILQRRYESGDIDANEYRRQTRLSE